MPPAKPTITWALHASKHAVGITVNAPGADSVTVWRVVDGFDPGIEPRYAVRGMIRRTDTTFTGFDIEYPQGTSVAYMVRAYSADGTGTSSDTPGAGTAVTPEPFGDVLIGGGATAWRVPIVVERVAPLTYVSRNEKIKVSGRRDLVVIGDRRQYPEFDLTFHTFDFTSYEMVKAMLYQFPVITLSPRYPRWADSMTAIQIAHDDVSSDAPFILRSELPGVREERTWSGRCTQVGSQPTPMVTTLPPGW